MVHTPSADFCRNLSFLQSRDLQKVCPLLHKLQKCKISAEICKRCAPFCKFLQKSKISAEMHTLLQFLQKFYISAEIYTFCRFM